MNRFFLLFLVSIHLSSSSSFSSHHPNCPFDNLQHYEYSIFSQNGEDGIIFKILSIIGITNKYYVEFGVENGKECNTRFLRERYQFHGLSMDGDHENHDINLQKEFITIHNILNLFEKYQVPQEFDILSIDLDLYDWWILAKILGSKKYSPRMIIVETNPTLGVSATNLRYEFHEMNYYPLTVTHPVTTNQTSWDLTRYSGANPKAFQLLAQQFGYEMIYCESCGVNCFLIKKELIPSTCLRSSSNHLPLPHISYPCFATTANGNRRGHPPDPLPSRTPLLVDSLLITLATTDSLSKLDRLTAATFLEQNTFRRYKYQHSFFHSSPYSNSLNQQLISSPTLHTYDVQHVANLNDLNKIEHIVLTYESEVFPTTRPLSHLQFCEKLDKKNSREDSLFPMIDLSCADISSGYAYLIVRNLIESMEKYNTDYAGILQDTRQLLTRGLSFSPTDQALLTIQKYVALSEYLTNSLTMGHGEFRYAHILESVDSPYGRKYLSIGVCVCDSIIHQSRRLARILRVDDSFIPKLTDIFTKIIKQEIYGLAFDETILNNSLLLSESQPFSLLNSIPSLFRVFFPQQYSNIFPNSPLISGSIICHHRSQSTVLLSFDSSIPISSDAQLVLLVQSINNQFISSCECDSSLLMALLTDSSIYDLQSINSNFSNCLQNLLQLSQGYLPTMMQQIYSTEIDNLLHLIYEITLTSWSNQEIYTSPFFPYTAALWSGPLGATMKQETNFRKIHLLIPFHHPFSSICQILQRYEKLNQRKQSIKELIEFYEISVRSIFHTIRYYSMSGSTLLYLPDMNENQQQMVEIIERMQLFSLNVVDFMNNISSSRIYSRSSSRRSSIPYHESSFTCDLMTTDWFDFNELQVPKWIVDCYHTFDFSQDKVLLITEKVLESIENSPCYEER